MERIEIYTSKKKAILLLIGSTIFVVLGVWIFLNSDNLEHHRYANPIINQVMGILSIVFFGLGVLLSIKRLIKSEISLIIDEKGIVISPKKSLPEYIEWKEIVKFEEGSIRNNKFIIIALRNPQHWVDKETSSIRKKLMQFNLNNYGSPFHITAAGLNISYQELQKTLDIYFEKYKTKVKDQTQE